MPIREIRVSYGRRVSGQETPASVKHVSDVVAVMRPLLEREACEVVVVLCLTTRMDLIGYHEVSRGTLDFASVHPREVFKVAMLANAAGIILVHNHPSGDPSPSPDDFALTARIKDAGQLMGIELLDSVIIGHDGRYASIKELGRL